ncbi:hypothetical protein VHN57_10120 [Sphingobium sp. WW5]|uniref:hypothetical protein n=1 Tax=unclassified Sphingobium TaxID=2611147 RepID=UPI000B30362D
MAVEKRSNANGTLDRESITQDATSGAWGVWDGDGSFSTGNALVDFVYGLGSVVPKYDLAIFGPNAEEVAGVIKLNTSIGNIGIAGAQ